MKGVRAAHRLPGALVILGVLAASIGVVGLPPAAAMDQQLCTGYAGCVAAGYTDHGYGANATTMYWREYPGHNCTNYAAYVMSVVNKVPTPTYRLGNASEWAAAAAAHGVPVDSTPAIGSVAFWTPNTEGVGSAGHVAVVERIDADSITVSDDAFSGDFHWDKLTVGGYYPSAFIHFKDLAPPPPGAATGYQVGFQANTGFLYTYTSTGTVTDLGLGMRAGTSPSVARLPGGGYAMAFQANTGDLYTVDHTGIADTHLGMRAGTSPSLAVSPSGHYQVSFQANTGSLYTYTSTGTVTNLGLEMAAGSSPSSVAVPTGGYQIAYQAADSKLTIVNYTGAVPTVVSTGLGMYAATSPAIALSPVSVSGTAQYQAVFQANTTSLYSYQSSGAVADLQHPVMAGTSPAIAARPKGGYDLAYQADSGDLMAIDATGTVDTRLGMNAITSPSITVSPTGDYVAMFQANTGDLYRYASSGAVTDLRLGMMSGTDPRIS